MQVTTSARLKKALLLRNMKQSQLVECTGIGKSAISQYLSGKVNPKQDKIYLMAKALNVDEGWLMGYDVPMVKNQLGDIISATGATTTPPAHRQGVRIPVLGRVVAGIPIEAITDILDYEEIEPDLARTGEFFALQVNGTSMEPKLYDGDVVIVRRQPEVETGETAIVLVNGDEATVKQVKSMDTGIMLIGHNTAVYEPHFYSNEDIATLPIQILGKVIELRRKF